ncbi:tail fiber protein [Klebsiella aerogenes]|nr:tail fiber protein [Klebsiella aerogenes]
MRKVGSTTDTADSNGEWTNGNVANGIPPTIINAEMLNTFQRELVAVVEGAGMELDPGDDGQVIKAIANIVNISVPAGIPMPWPKETPPTGWLKCNGAPFDISTYPLLANAYPSGQLPDLRGEFIRGWDDGRGVDSGRAILSAQGDTIRNIVGSINALGAESGAFYYSKTPSTGSWVHWAADTATHDVLTYGFDASRVVPTSSENRPRNIVFNYIVRAA